MTELDDVNIRHIKLVTGDELIAIVLSNEELGEDANPDLLIVQKPMVVQFRTEPEGTTFVFYEWQPLSKEDTCFINPFHIISHVECDNSVKEQYINVCVNNDPSNDDGDTDTDHDEPHINIPSDRILH